MTSVPVSAILTGLLLLAAVPLRAGELVIDYDSVAPERRAALQAVIADFEAENPDIRVSAKFTGSDEYRVSIRGRLTKQAADIVAWHAGDRMTAFAAAGLFEDVTDVWQEAGYDGPLAAFAPSVTAAGRKWGVPYTASYWGVYYRRDIFEDLGIAAPATWAELVEACARLKEEDLTPIAIGTRSAWSAAGLFDYLDLRVNGPDFHDELIAGKVAYSDPRVQAVFDRWDELIKPGYFSRNHSASSWEDALAPLVRGRAAMMVTDAFAVAPLEQAGLDERSLGLFAFPAIEAGMADAVQAPTATLHIPAAAANKADARRFLAFVGQAGVQTKWNAMIGQLPVNAEAEVAEDNALLAAAFAALKAAGRVVQPYEQAVPAAMAGTGMVGFRDYMNDPDRREEILKHLDETARAAYGG